MSWWNELSFVLVMGILFAYFSFDAYNERKLEEKLIEKGYEQCRIPKINKVIWIKDCDKFLKEYDKIQTKGK